jgi:lauroyl/myristoyl acyltransferase
VRGGCVWIAGERPARLKNIPVPFLGRRKAFATGAPSLAWSTGAALLPVYTIRKGTFDYETVVGRPITPRTEASLKAVYVKAAVTEFAAILEQKILAYPANWTWTAYSVYQLLARKRSR